MPNYSAGQSDFLHDMFNDLETGWYAKKITPKKNRWKKDTLEKVSEKKSPEKFPRKKIPEKCFLLKENPKKFPRRVEEFFIFFSIDPTL